MKEEKDSTLKIAARVTLGNKVYYYCSDGNVYIADYKTRKLNRVDDSEKIAVVKNRFIMAKGNNDVIVKKTDNEMDR